jgi:hypothetical protein
MVHISRMGGGAVAVADGVGGWNAKGVNPAAYSRCLVHFARVAAVQEERERQTTAKATGLMAMVRALAAGLTKKDLTAQGLMSRAQARPPSLQPHHITDRIVHGVADHSQRSARRPQRQNTPRLPPACEHNPKTGP